MYISLDMAANLTKPHPSKSVQKILELRKKNKTQNILSHRFSGFNNQPYYLSLGE